ncbi:hypothetical protein LTR95_006316 [Oleoguttula sp. CCFEE 5521]
MKYAPTKSAHVAILCAALSSLAAGAPTSHIHARQGCEAPYQRIDGAYEGHYMVEVAEGYTLDDHFKYLGGAFAVEVFWMKGVDIYVFDSGIAHLDEFKTADGVDRVVDELDMSDELSFEDLDGHGTKVATAIGGATRGIARAATLRSVKITQNNRPHSAVFVRALQVIIRRHIERAKSSDFRGSVCNFSLDLHTSAMAVKTIKWANAAGITMIAAAGNHGYYTRHFPSSDPLVISVGAMQEDYKPWKARGTIYSSNYGKNEVAVWAPGAGLQLFTNTGAPTIGSAGTSFATGYVSGIYALFYGNERLN